MYGLACQILTANPASHYRLAEVALEAPLPRPGKILCSGINYRSHQQENQVLEDVPLLLMRAIKKSIDGIEVLNAATCFTREIGLAGVM